MLEQLKKIRIHLNAFGIKKWSEKYLSQEYKKNVTKELRLILNLLSGLLFIQFNLLYTSFKL
jgi:hypothetical protein